LLLVYVEVKWTAGTEDVLVDTESTVPSG